MKIVLNGSIIDTEKIYEITQIKGMRTLCNDLDCFEAEAKKASEVQWYQFEINFLGTKKVKKVVSKVSVWNGEDHINRKVVDVLEDITQCRKALVKYWENSPSPLPEIKTKYYDF
jgi:hypothetical protein